MALSQLEHDTRRIVGRLTHLGVRQAIVGGLAVSARTEPRFTRDVDIAVSVESDQAAERLIHALSQDGYVPAASIEQEATGRIATVRLTETRADQGGSIIDLLFASSGIEQEVVDTAEVIDLFSGFSVPVATIPALIALKLLARDDVSRPQDRVDLVGLLTLATPTDRAEVRSLCELITRRGYGRGRNLLADLARFESELQP